MNKFPCFSCGKCCKKVHLSSETDFLNRGDGICKHYKESDNSCSIYDDRPDICSVEIQYKKHYSHVYTWEVFVEINLEVCKKLNDGEL